MPDAVATALCAVPNTGLRTPKTRSPEYPQNGAPVFIRSRLSRTNRQARKIPSEDDREKLDAAELHRASGRSGAGDQGLFCE